MSAEHIVNIRLLDVNDNVPKLVESETFICMMKPEPVLLKATDQDDTPFSQPFTFVLGKGQKSPNWDLSPVDGMEDVDKKKGLDGKFFSYYFLSYRFDSETHAEENPNRRDDLCTSH